jgi:hypothetical protein
MYSLNDFEINLTFLIRRIEDVRKESDDTKWNIETDTVFVPFVFVG